MWENPFLVGVDRRATTRNDLAFNLGFARPLTESTMWTAGYRLTSTRISSDTTAATHPDLGREGLGHILSGGYRWGTDSIELSYNTFSADGKADSHQDFLLSYFTFRNLTDRLMLIGSVSLGRTRYETVHPVFARTREETVGSVLAIFMYNNFLGNPKRYAVFGSYAGIKQSNLEFFDSQLNILFAGVGWRF